MPSTAMRDERALSQLAVQVTSAVLSATTFLHSPSLPRAEIRISR